MITAEYAPRHNRKTRLRIALVWLMLGALAFAFLHFIYFPFLHDLSENGKCREVFGQPALVVLIYASIIPLPFILFTASLFLLPIAIPILRSSIYPPPGHKTLRLVRIRRGRAAVLRGWLMITYMTAAFATLIYAFVVANVYVSRYHANAPQHIPCT